MGSLTHSEVEKRFRSARYRVWRYICEHPGCTDIEVRVALGLNKNTARPRRIELEHAGLVRLVLPPKRDELGNVSERWEATGAPYPDSWRAPKANNGDALALRAARRLRQWAEYVDDASLVEMTRRLEGAVEARVA